MKIIQKKVRPRFILSLFVASILFQTIFLPISGLFSFEKVQAASQTVSFDAIDDTFVSPSTLNPANGARRSLFLGSYTDYTIPGDPLFFRSRGLVKFGNLSPTIPAGAVVTAAKLHVWHYGTNPGHQPVYVTRVTSGWNGNTIWTGPSYDGVNYGQSTFPTYNSDFDAVERVITLNTSLINSLMGGNEGIGILSTNETQPGVVICSSNIPSGPCHGGMHPQLEVTYFVNQPPYQPNPVSPLNNSEFSGNCDQSVIPNTGICNTNTNINVQVNGVGDGDTAPGDLAYTVFNYTQSLQSGSSSFNSGNLTGSGTVTHAGSFADGSYIWRARSIDNQSVWGSYSANQNFWSDTTPPSIPNIQPMPAFSNGLNGNIQVDVNIDPSTDNVFAQNALTYQLEYSPIADFSDPLQIYVKPWQTATNFQIGEFGADNIQGTSDDLANDATYYFRAKSRDKVTVGGLFNSSNYSTITSTIIDVVVPVISNDTIDNLRISPNNSTSIGEYDNTNISFDYVEKYGLQAGIEIKDSANNILNTLTQDVSGQDGNTSSQSVNFIWDGKNSANTYLPDDTYVVTPYVSDKAGNVTQLASPYLVIVDNNETNVQLSSAADYWTNLNFLNITGSIKLPDDPGENDSDISTLQVCKGENDCSNISNWHSVSWDASDVFDINATTLPGIFPFNLGSNTYYLKTEDLVGNEQTKIWDPASTTYIDYVNLHYETTAPVISDILPNSLINDRQPSISFAVSDPDPTADGLQRSDIPTGTNPYGFEVYLTFNTWNGSGWDPQTKNLIGSQTNFDPGLISDLACSTDVSGVSTTKNNRASGSVVNCSLNFISDLQPDTTYTIHVKSKDNADNESTLTQDFTLDSYNFGEVTTPIDNSIYSSESVKFIGKSVKGNTVTITNQNLARSRTFTLNESLNGTGMDVIDGTELITSNFIVTCGEFMDIDTRSDTPDEEVCSYEVWVKQEVARDASNAPLDQNISNVNTIVYSDAALNLVTITKTINTNLLGFDLVLDSDLEFFSPNGDGNQDGINFTHSATNPTDPAQNPLIDTWSLQVRDSSSNIVKEFTGTGFLPSGTVWDGKDSGGVYVADGTYSVTLSVTTTDGATKLAGPLQLFAVTILLDEVVITNPKTGYVTTDGVINIQGQAPSSRPIDGQGGPLVGIINVTICIDTITTPNDVACDMEATVVADVNGFFSTVIALPRVSGQTQTVHNITAKAQDSFGNVTNQSNLVEVILDTVDPFNYVSITPTLTGITTQEDFLKFLNGEIGIDSIRSVRLNANVTQNTEQVEYSFTNYTNVISKPTNPTYGLIGTVTNESETNALLNPGLSPDIKHLNQVSLGDGSIAVNNCATVSGCNFDYYLPIDSTYGGIYEVKFKAKKGSLVNELTAGFEADGTIPASPIIMLVEKGIGGNYSILSTVSGKYYTNVYPLRLRGAAEPNSILTIKDTLSGNVITTVTTNAFGIWEANVDLGAYVNSQTEFNFIVETTDGVNTIQSTNSANVVFDNTLPEVVSITRQTPTETIPGWVRTGDIATYQLSASEKLWYALLIKEDNYFKSLTDIGGGLNFLGSINVDRLAEGYYNPILGLQDLAGNQNSYDAELWETYGLGDFRLYIDNTLPESTLIDTSTWSTQRIQGGVNATGLIPEIGRTNPGYVTKASSITLRGVAEAHQRVEIWINNARHTIVNVGTAGCVSTAIDKITSDGLVTKYGSKCNWEYVYTFPDNGDGDDFGEPYNRYIFQARVKDAANNLSGFSNQEIIFHDLEKPINPIIYNAKSASYDPIVDWHSSNASGNLPITKDINVTLTTFAERFADMSWVQTSPANIQTSFAIYENSSTRFGDKEFAMGTASDDRNGCTTVVNGRRLGTCEDGTYKFRLATTDAAGNVSNSTESSIERDTVKPLTPSVNVSKNGAIGDEKLALTISGEPGTVAKIEVTSTAGNKTFNFKLDSNGKYSTSYLMNLVCGEVKYNISVKLIDRAQNISDAKLGSIISGECPRCGYEGGLLASPIHTSSWSVSSPFGDRPGGFHEGIDMADAKRTPVYAAAPGKVIRAKHTGGVPGGSPNYVTILHDDGKITEYFHFDNEANAPVVVGQRVDINSVIGYIGNTGDVLCYEAGKGWVTPSQSSHPDTCGVHLHFGVYINGVPVDPQTYFGSGPNVECDADVLGSSTVDKTKAIEKIKERFAEFGDPFGGHYELEKEQSICGSYKYELIWDPVWPWEGDYFKGEIIYNPTKDKAYFLPDGQARNKYYAIDDYCNNLGIIKREETQAAKASDNNRVSGQLWFEFDKGDIYEFTWDAKYPKTAWAVFGMIRKEYNEAHSGSDGDLGFPTGDTYPKPTYCKQWFQYDKELDLCNTIPQTDTIILDVPLIREDVCQYNDVTLYNNYTFSGSSNCGYLCGYNRPVTGCHVIAVAMINSFFRNNKQAVDVKEFNKVAERYVEGGENDCNLRYYSSKDAYVGPSHIYKLYASKDEGEPESYYNNFYLKSSNDINFNVKYSKSASGKTIQQSIDDSLKSGRPVMIQLIYGNANSGTYHAFPIVGKKNGQYVVNDSFYGRGQKFTTLNQTIDTLIGGGGASGQSDYVKLNQIFFYYNSEVPNNPFLEYNVN